MELGLRLRLGLGVPPVLPFVRETNPNFFDQLGKEPGFDSLVNVEVCKRGRLMEQRRLANRRQICVARPLVHVKQLVILVNGVQRDLRDFFVEFRRLLRVRRKFAFFRRKTLFLLQMLQQLQSLLNVGFDLGPV